MLEGELKRADMNGTYLTPFGKVLHGAGGPPPEGKRPGTAVSRRQMHSGYGLSKFHSGQNDCGLRNVGRMIEGRMIVGMRMLAE